MRSYGCLINRYGKIVDQKTATIVSQPVGSTKSDHNQIVWAANSNYFKKFCNAQDLFAQSINASGNNKKIADLILVIDQMTKIVSGADAFNVDPGLQAVVLDYIRYVGELRGSLSELAYSQSNENLSRNMVEAFIRGANGDPFGTSMEVIQLNKRLENEIFRSINKIHAVVTQANSRAFQLGLISRP